MKKGLDIVLRERLREVSPRRTHFEIRIVVRRCMVNDIERVGKMC
jgi:hypothetical protein